MSYKTLPCQADVFEALVSGKHVSSEDGDIYYALRDSKDDYCAFFASIRMELVADPRGFFYLVGGRAPANMQGILFFVMILMEHYDENGYSVESLVTGDPLFYREMPHLNHQRWAEVIKRAAGVTNLDGLRAIVKSMARYGFVAHISEESFRFRVGAYRLLEAVRDAKNQVESSEETGDGGEIREVEGSIQ